MCADQCYHTTRVSFGFDSENKTDILIRNYEKGIETATPPSPRQQHTQHTTTNNNNNNNTHDTTTTPSTTQQQQQ